MALRRLQVTIGAAAAQPTRFTATRRPFRWAAIEADDGNSNPAFVGPSDVAAANGIRLNNSATAPGRIIVGPFSGEGPDSLDNWFVAGTEGEIVNVIFIPH